MKLIEEIFDKFEPSRKELEDYEPGGEGFIVKREQQIAIIEKELIEAGFKVHIPITKVNTQNRMYYKEDVDVVLCVIDRKKLVNKYAPNSVDRSTYYNLIDKKTFDDFILPRNGKFNVNWNRKGTAEENGNVWIYADVTEEEKKEGTKEGLVPVRIAGGYALLAIRNYWKSHDKDKTTEVDHRTHNRLINLATDEYVRECNRRENSRNKKTYRLAKIDEKKLLFRIQTEKLYSLISSDVLKKKFGISDNKSKKYTNCEELYSDVKQIEDMAFGKFRYDPLVDFSETWYILVYEKMLKKISKEEREDYQRYFWGEKYLNIKDPERKKELESFLKYYMYDYYKKLLN